MAQKTLQTLRTEAKDIIAKDPAVLDSLPPIEKMVIVILLTGLDNPDQKADGQQPSGT
jgi:hypothetical protein